MIMKLFGTDGIRGLAGAFPLNSHGIAAIGRAIGERLGGRILVGQDTRLSSPWICGLLERGIRAGGATIENAGVLPTPAIALLTQRHNYSGGVVISASHNPYEDNGIKVFAADGRKLKDADEAAVERRVLELLGEDPLRRAGEDVPPHGFPVTEGSHLRERYQELLQSHFTGGRWMQGLRIVVDCANGAMSQVAPSLLRRLGADVALIHASPSGTNINAACGAVHMDSLRSAMSGHAADFGVAFDGDGDRSLFVSGAGRLVDGDGVLLLMARRLKRLGRLIPSPSEGRHPGWQAAGARPSVVGTLMTNYSLERMLQELDIVLKRVAVGDRFIFEEMLRSGSVLGGEPSGHIIFSDFGLSGDGLLTTLKVAEAVLTEHSSFDDLTQDWVQAPQLLKNVRVAERVPLELLPAVQAKMAEVVHELQGCGRLVVRYSGTEPLLRVMIESDDAGRNDRLMADLLRAIHDSIRVP